ncbi:MAG: hypothetical protein ABR911_05330 [Syntrophales bacterium]|jgi:hypothetical protein
MKSMDSKVMVAISAAIGAYLEAESVAAMAASEAEAVPSAAPYASINIWAIAGRQDVMFTRRMWQMRTY